MIRTRDFLLFVVATGFLLIAITATVATGREAEPAPVPFASVPSTEYSAEVPQPTLDRQERVATLKAKIAAQEGQSIAAVYEETVVPDGEETPTTPATTTSQEIQRCPDYAPVTIDWPAKEVKTAEREGARIVYTMETATAPAAGSSTVPEVTETENVLLQLPMRTQPLPNTSCIPNDVVGVALDGSLIRNGDHQLYGIFGPETLIGYALDGFPIYGNAGGEIELDECGGAMLGTGYRYYLHPDRPGVLGCFAGTPARL